MKLWVVINTETRDVLDVVEAPSAYSARRLLAVRWGLTPEERQYIDAFPADYLLDIRIPGYLISALEYSPEFAFGPRETAPDLWEEYERVADQLNEKVVVDWVRVDAIFDLWCPVIE